MVAELKTAVFAGGCFWCVQAVYDGTPGVASVTSGYTGGTTTDPSYEDVSSGRTGHVEAVEIVYDPSKVTYSQLLDIFWENIDPMDPRGQFCDKGAQYHSVIFYADEEQKTQAEATLHKIEERLKAKVATLIVPASKFYPAEDYHQNYHKKNPLRYQSYKALCGRDDRLKQLWGKD